MAVWGTRQLTALLFFSLQHFGQPCERQFVQRVVFSRTREESVSLSSPAETSTGFSSLIWKRNDVVVARIRNSSVINAINGTKLFKNGTLELQKPEKTDRGVFESEGHDATGKCIFSGRIWLEVQDPVSQPVVSLVSCDSGRAVLRCEVERGDTVSFWWGVMGGSVDTSLEVIAERGPVLFVESSISGELVCMANNSVSAETSAPLNPTCPGSKNSGNLLILLCVCGSLLAMVILFVVILCITSRVKERPDMGVGVEPAGCDVMLLNNHPSPCLRATATTSINNQTRLDPNKITPNVTFQEEEYTDMQFKTAAKDVGDEGNHSTFSDEEILTGQTAEEDGLYIAMTNIMQPTESCSTFRMNQTLSEASNQGCGPYPLQTERSSDVVYAQIYIMKRVKSTPGKELDFA
ncbi:hypothetical protein AAFF_G00319330 [Aldrovandia affinis]|uniref:Ig-like domain-containing protein n=1 Tax=Aldrovandia affinis TaxID=143900 RepID=A0AAD7SN24_9TELE|nr:hypothetical protein AAFF_G00319330 [Aldrovandia affinis]